MLRRSLDFAAVAAIAVIGFSTSAALADSPPRQGYVIVRKDGRKIEGKITVKGNRVEIELGKGSSTDFAADEVTITYTEGAGDAADPTTKKRIVEIEKKEGGTVRGEVVEEKGDSITIKPRGQGPLTFKLSEVKGVTTIESEGGEADLGDRFVDFEGRFQIERPNADWKLRKSTSPETRALMALVNQDAFIAISVKPAAAATAAAYADPTRDNARKVQSEVEGELKVDLEKSAAIQLDLSELFGAPVIEARYEGRYPSETTDYQFIEQRFVRDGLLYSIKAAAEKKNTFKVVEPKLREAFTCFSFIAPQGGDDTGYNDLLKGYGLERPTEKWTVDARPFDEREPVIVRAEDGKAEIRVLVGEAGGRDASQCADEYLKATDKRNDFSVIEKKESRRGATPVTTYHCAYFEGRNVSKFDEQGLMTVVDNRLIHVVGIAPFAGPESKDLQKEVSKALESFKVFDPKRKGLTAGANAVAEYGRGVDAYKKRQFNEALSFLNEAIKLYPDYARAYFWRATCQVELKGWKEYRDDVARACDLDGRPEMQTRSAALNYAEAQARVKDKQWTDACRAWKEAVRNDPKNDKYRKDFIRFYQDWWQELKRQNQGVKAKDGIDDIDEHRWSDKEFEPILATMWAEAGSMVLAADKKQWAKARQMAGKALSYDKGCKSALDLQKQCDETKKQLDAANNPKKK